MSTPDALRLAEMLDAEFVAGRISNHTGRRAATELRGQHAEIVALRAEVAEWEKLRNPVTLHVSLLRGLPCKLDSATFLHLPVTLKLSGCGLTLRGIVRVNGPNAADKPGAVAPRP